MRATVQPVFLDRLSRLRLHGYRVVVIGLNRTGEKSTRIKERVSHRVFEMNIYIVGSSETSRIRYSVRLMKKEHWGIMDWSPIVIVGLSVVFIF